MKLLKPYKPRRTQRRKASNVRLDKRVGQASRMPGDHRPRISRSWSDFYKR